MTPTPFREIKDVYPSMLKFRKNLEKRIVFLHGHTKKSKQK